MFITIDCSQLLQDILKSLVAKGHKPAVCPFAYLGVVQAVGIESQLYRHTKKNKKTPRSRTREHGTGETVIHAVCDWRKHGKPNGF